MTQYQYLSINVSSLSLTISSANILLKALVYIQFFNQGLTHTLLFYLISGFVVFLENMYSISNKLNTWFSFRFIFLMIVLWGFFFTYFICISWNQTKCNEICIKLVFDEIIWKNISQSIIALILGVYDICFKYIVMVTRINNFYIVQINISTVFIKSMFKNKY